jgi:hypothetical protein
MGAAQVPASGHSPGRGDLRGSGGVAGTAGNSKGAAEGMPLLPWQDHKGHLNEPLWRGLVQRAISVVVRNPGMRSGSHCYRALELPNF